MCAEILGFQEKVLYELEGRLNKWTSKSVIGDVFVTNAEGLKLYVTYVNNYDNALSAIRVNTKENPKFKEFLKESVHREAGDAQDITSLLITVVQRPPRYCLLLKELLKHTPESHKDRRPLLEALGAVEKAAEYINTQKMIAEGHAQGLKIRSAFQDKFAFSASTGPQVLYDGEIKAQKRGKLRVVVFNNYFLVGEEKTSLLGRKKAKYEPLVWCPLDHVTLNPANDTSLTAAFTNPAQDAVGGNKPLPSSNSSASLSPATPQASPSHSNASSPKHTPASPSSSSSSTPSSSSSPPPSPTLILSVPNIVFTWENHETLQAWMAIVAEAQAKLKTARETRARGTSIFASLFKW